MSVDARVRERILKAVEDIRKAAAKYSESTDKQPTATIHPFPARLRAVRSATEADVKHAKLHLMLAKPHTSIW